MRTKRIFCIVAYDVTDTKRRNKVIKLVEPYGKRINYSVFECMMTRTQFEAMCSKLAKTVNSKTDKIAIYPICLDCYGKTRYIPDIKTDYNIVHIYD